MKVEQHVMAYEAEQDRLRALLPGGFVSLRPMLRNNAEIRDDLTGYVELNTPVEHEGCRGWLNVGHWQDVPFARQGKTVIFRTDFLEISFTGVGIGGRLPCRKGQRRLLLPGGWPSAEKNRVHQHPLGILRLRLPLAVHGCGRPRRQPGQDPTGLSDPVPDGVPPDGAYPGQRGEDPLRPGAGGLHGGI